MLNQLRIVTSVSVLTLVMMVGFGEQAPGKDRGVELAGIFGDGMVLQRDKEVWIWGWASKGEKVEVRFGGQMKETTANGEGRWEVKLGAMKASFEGRALTAKGSNGGWVTIKDVLVGEVWLCGGQSNMAWSLRGSRDADVEIGSADDKALRFIRLPLIARNDKQEDITVSKEGNSGWKRAVSDEVENCTAVGYHFGRRLRRMLKVPVGLIDNSWGGTMAQHWCDEGTLAKIEEMKPYIEHFEARMKKWNEGGGEAGAKKRHYTAMKVWEVENAKARNKGERVPRRPRLEQNPGHGRQPGGMYNGLIWPIRKMTIRGVLFYQGENNSFGESWKPFYKTFPSVISDWRKAFGDAKLPFGIVQIAGWSNRRTMTYDMNHHTNVVREIQFLTWRKTAGTGLIVTFDTNSNGSIHPGRKAPVGERSARWALAEVYGVKGYRSRGVLEWKGPIYKGYKVEGGKVVISFEEGTARGLRLDQDSAQGFYIAGSDKKFVVAKARVKGSEVEVWHEDVKEPVAVRYASSNLPLGTLMNGKELPAYPFRTDRWPLVPHRGTSEYRVEKVLGE